MCEQGNEKEIKLTDGTVRSCDECIQPFVQMLNDFGWQTLNSCCGHGKRPTTVILKDGREIHILPNWYEGRIVDGLYPPLHWWEKGNLKYKVKMWTARKILFRNPIITQYEKDRKNTKRD